MSAPEELKKVPSGLAHVGFLSAANKYNRTLSEPVLNEFKTHLVVLGTALEGLYTSATCHRSCHGGDHIIEALGGRVYNLACASYSLISVGFYDEALSLVRSIGEIANLLSLLMFDTTKFEEWINSAQPDRMRNFSPAKVRQSLEKSGLLLMDKDWYADLCESYTHVSPQTAPNKYDLGRNVCGGRIQKAGAEKAIDQLTNITAIVSLYFCRYSSLDDIFERLRREFKHLPEKMRN